MNVVEHVDVLIAVDKFRGTATAAQVASAIALACDRLRRSHDQVVLADGGEGTLDVLGGPNRCSVVAGPLGAPVRAGWRLHQGTAVIEMARASGLQLVGGSEGNYSVEASTYGTGQLISEALADGAERIIVCLGGSATTDGGYGALLAIPELDKLREVELLVACDVTTRFVDAAAVFGPQKGADADEVVELTKRLEGYVELYQRTYGVDVSAIPGAGAAGGLAGGLVAAGGRLVPGFDLVAAEQDLERRVQRASVVVTGEGKLDRTSFDGKVVGGVQRLASRHGVPVGCIAGVVDEAVRDRIEHISLSARFGTELSFSDPLGCIGDAAAELVQRLAGARAT